MRPCGEQEPCDVCDGTLKCPTCEGQGCFCDRGDGYDCGDDDDHEACIDCCGSGVCAMCEEEEPEA